MNLHRQIDSLLSRFNFEKVQRAMQALDWTWSDDVAIPDIVRMRDTARRLLVTAATCGTNYCSSGGFTARREDSGYLTLAFEVESAGEPPSAKL